MTRQTPPPGAVQQGDQIINSERGIYIKYDVRKVETGEMVFDCFVLRPDRDAAARDALRFYAKVTSNRALAANLLDWIRQLEKPPVVYPTHGEVGES